MPGPSAYAARTDRAILTKPTLPTLGAAGTTILDPTFGTRILRVSDSSTHGGASIRTLGGAGNTQAFNTTTTRFIVTDTSGNILLYDFNSATMQATFVRTLNFDIKGVTFSVLDPDTIYGLSTSFVEATITKYNCATNTYTTIVGVRTLVPTVDDVNRTYLRGVSTGVSGGAEYLSFIFGGYGQEHDFYAYWAPVTNPVISAKILDTVNNTINGSACTTIGMYLHAGRVEMGGRYVILGPSQSVSGTHGQPVPATIIWDTTTDSISFLDFGGSDNGGGHGADGFGAQINFPDNADGMESIYRAYSAPTTSRALIPGPLPGDFIIANHASWSNADPSTLVPVIAAWYRWAQFISGSYVPNTSPWHAWDEEVVAVSTNTSGIVYRFCHHRSETNNRNDAVFDLFWSYPKPNASQDGKWALFTSNWELGLGTDSIDGLKRQDSFIVELPASTIDHRRDNEVHVPSFITEFTSYGTGTSVLISLPVGSLGVTGRLAGPSISGTGSSIDHRRDNEVHVPSFSTEFTSYGTTGGAVGTGSFSILGGNIITGVRVRDL